MKKLLMILPLFTILLMARYDAYPVKECPAFNNMKHTHNTHHVIVDPKEKYTVLDSHHGQKLILVKGEQPAQRWVEGDCFGGKHSAGVKESGHYSREADSKRAESDWNRPKNLLLALSWHNAFCETHRSRRECRREWSGRSSDNRFVLHGLWPQPRDNLYCNVPKEQKEYDKRGQWSRLPRLELSEETREKLARTMPGSISNLHRHEWIKHGTCFGSDPESYFKEAIRFTEQFNRSKIKSFFASNAGKVVTLRQIRFKVDESFGKTSGKKVEMVCKKGLITELWLHLGSEGDTLSSLLKSGRELRSRCRKGRIDRAGFQ